MTTRPCEAPARSPLNNWAGELCVGQIVAFETAELVVMTNVALNGVHFLQLFVRVSCNRGLNKMKTVIKNSQ